MAKKAMKGVVGLFGDPDKLMAAASQVRDRKVQAFDAFTPFAVHGLEHAMGLKRSFIPWVTFGTGVAAALGGLALEIWTSAYDWPLIVGGKPMNSLPAFVPVMFECGVLIGGLSTVAALIVACGLPDLNPQILDPALTNDKFALFVSAEDPQYQEKDFSDLMRRAGAYDVRVI